MRIRVGRPKKARFGDIVTVKDEALLHVVVDHRMIGTKAQYCVIPLARGYRRYGRAKWVPSSDVEPIGKRSGTASVHTYRANKWLRDELDDHTCECQCCVHTPMNRRDFGHITGKLREAPEDDRER